MKFLINSVTKSAWEQQEQVLGRIYRYLYRPKRYCCSSDVLLLSVCCSSIISHPAAVWMEGCTLLRVNIMGS